MNNFKNSLGKMYNDLILMNVNSNRLIESISKTMTSDDDFITIDLVGENDTIKSIQIPSFVNIENQIKTLNNNINILSGLNSSGNIKYSDGSLGKVYVSNLQKEPDSIKDIRVPNTFNTKENWFFESFLNPLLYININLGNQLIQTTKHVEVYKYLLNINNETKERLFNSTLLNKDDINFDEFITFIESNNIKYDLDKDVIKLPHKSVRYNGYFDVTDIKLKNVNINNILYEDKYEVSLNTLFYNDIEKNNKLTEELRINDNLILVNNDIGTTKYKIIDINYDENKVILDLIEGLGIITIGGDVLKISKLDTNDMSVDINVSFDEYAVIFIKPIDPDSNLVSNKYSPGFAIYTNELTMKLDNEDEISLAQYYREKVTDFGAFLYSSVNDISKPSRFAIKPNKPTIVDNNFKVVRINSHKKSVDVDKVLEKNKQKNDIQKTIESLDVSIISLKNRLNTSRYTNDKARSVDEVELNKKIEERKSSSVLLESLVDDINTISSKLGIKDNPKYRIRGFFDIPEPTYHEHTGHQEIIQFQLQYRYLGKDGAANKIEEYEYIDSDGSLKRGSFTNWVEVDSPVRERFLNNETNLYEWKIRGVDVENSDIIKINQIDIPISPDEKVEFRIRSISEVGWPLNVIKSDWSDIIKIDFPSTLETLSDTDLIAEQTKRDKVKIELLSDLNAMNFDKIINSAFTQQDNFYISDTRSIASGFVTDDQNIISLFDKLNEMQNSLKSLTSLIESTKGNLEVTIVDSNGKEYKAGRNETVKIFAGHYTDDIEYETIKKGTIVTKTYLIKLTNTEGSTLELYSRLYGNKNLPVDENTRGILGDYDILRKYNLVPIGLNKKYTNSEMFNYNYINNLPNQSKQVQGQFIYSRFVSVDGMNDLYGDNNNVTENYIYLPKTNESLFDKDTDGDTNSYVWWPSGNEVLEMYKNNSIEENNKQGNNYIHLHVNHPDIKILRQKIASNNNSDVLKKYIKQSSFINRTVNDDYYYQQAMFKTTFNRNINVNTNVTEDYINNTKLCFVPNDKYLIGPGSCGAYLFMNPNSYDDITVNGENALSTKALKFGNNNSILIPLVFQYRMTDYSGTSNNGSGNIAGIHEYDILNNLEYTKKIGIDIFDNIVDKNIYSFDVEMTARYRSESMSNINMLTNDLTGALTDLIINKK